MDNNHHEDIWLVYDGECPVCSFSARIVKIRQSLGNFHIVSAREAQHPLLAEIHQAGLDLNEGIVLKWNGVLYHGADALHVIALIGSDSDWFNKISIFLFKRKWFAKLTYPILKTFHHLILWFKRAPIIPTLGTATLAQPWQHFPIFMQKHYANKPYTQDSTTIQGKMDVDYRGLFLLLAPVLGMMGMLVPYKGKNIPVTVLLQSKPDSADLYFNRTFYFPNKKPYQFRSYMRYIGDNTVIEFLKGGLGTKMQYMYDGEKIDLVYKGYVWKLGRFIMPLPLAWFMGKAYTQKRALSDNAFSLHMEIKHPLWGVMYSYAGELTIDEGRMP